MKINLLLSLLLIGFITFVSACQETHQEHDHHQPTRSLKRYDRPDASILRGVEIPEGAALFHTSGLVAPLIDENAAAGSGLRYGDTYTQSVGIMERIKELLEEADLGMEDIVFLRVYMVPDRNNDMQIDWQGWFKAYSEYFNNEENPNKVARSTIGVYALANPDLLIEIEALAVYPNP